MATAKAFKAPAAEAPVKGKPSAPRLPRSVEITPAAPTFAAQKAAAKKMLNLKIRENDIKASRKEPTALLVTHAQGETFDFPEGKVRVSKDCPERPTNLYALNFDQNAWDSLKDDEEKAALQERLIALGVVTMTRKIIAATPSRVSVYLAGDKEE